ncbi:hypothetical protein JXI42_08775 [bacterium]|nr:hypothetical protein [bacterium]
MIEKKYSEYILKQTPGKNPNIKTSAGISVVLEGREDWCGIKHRMKWAFVSQPVLIVDKPHSHDFDEVLCFLSRDPADELDFGAEVELSLGREGEKQIINSPSMICIPKGLIHCPLNFVKISKPILFVHIYISPEYVRKLVS